jgi:hypothetical protein
MIVIKMDAADMDLEKIILDDIKNKLIFLKDF